MQQRFSTCSDLLIVDCSLRQALVGPYISKLHINKLHIACTVICMCRLMHVQTYVCGILHTGLAVGRIGLDTDFLEVNTS